MDNNQAPKDDFKHILQDEYTLEDFANTLSRLWHYIVSFIMIIADYLLEVVKNFKWVLKISFFISFIFLVLNLLQTYSYLKKSRNSYVSKAIFSVTESQVTKDGRFLKRKIRPNDLSPAEEFDDIISKMLLLKVTVDGKENFIANHFIDVFNLHNKFAQEEFGLTQKEKYSLEGFYFTHDSIENFTIKEKRALAIMQGIARESQIRGRMTIPTLFNFDVDTSGLYAIRVSTPNSDLSYQIIENFVASLKESYFERRGAQFTKSLEVLEQISDSLLVQYIGAKKDLEKISRIIESEKAPLIRDLLKGNTQILPDQLMTKESSFDLEISSQKLLTKSELYENTINQLQNLEYEKQNKIIEFNFEDKTYKPIKYDQTLLEAVLQRPMVTSGPYVGSRSDGIISDYFKSLKKIILVMILIVLAHKFYVNNIKSKRIL